MAKIVSLRLKDEIYELFHYLAESENRPLSNFIETSVLKFIEKKYFVDEFEMKEIQNNKDLNNSLSRAFKDIEIKKGRFVE